MLRQEGRCANRGTRLILGFFVFDHRPPLALRADEEDANDPDRLAAICWTCDQQKTPQGPERDRPSQAAGRRAPGLGQAHAGQGAGTAAALLASVAQARAKPWSLQRISW